MGFISCRTTGSLAWCGASRTGSMCSRWLVPFPGDNAAYPLGMSVLHTAQKRNFIPFLLVGIFLPSL